MAKSSESKKFDNSLLKLIDKYAHLPPEEIGYSLVSHGVSLVTNATTNLEFGLKALNVSIVDGLRSHVEHINDADLEKNTRKIAKELGCIITDHAM